MGIVWLAGQYEWVCVREEKRHIYRHKIHVEMAECAARVLQRVSLGHEKRRVLSF